MTVLRIDSADIEAVLLDFLPESEVEQAMSELEDRSQRMGVDEVTAARVRRVVEGRGLPRHRPSQAAPVVGAIQPAKPPLTEDQLWVAELLFGFEASDEVEGDFMEQLLDQVTGMNEREWSMAELDSTLALLKERGLINSQNRGQPTFHGGMGRYVERLNAVVSLELLAFADAEIVEVGDRQRAALDYMAETLRSTGRPATSKGVGLYWLGSVKAGRGLLHLSTQPLLLRFGLPRTLGLDLRPEDVQAIWLADTSLSWDDIDIRGEEPGPELLEELGIEVTEDEVRMGALRLPLGLNAQSAGN